MENTWLALSNDYFFLCIVSIINVSSVVYEHPPLTNTFCGTTPFAWKQTPVLCRSLSRSTLQIPQSTSAWLTEKIWDIYSLVLAHLTTLLGKFNTKPQVKQKAFLNICGSLSYLCPQTICPLRYPKAVTVFKKSASTETESFSKQSGRLTDFILSASILWFYLLILISLRPPVTHYVLVHPSFHLSERTGMLKT